MLPNINKTLFLYSYSRSRYNYIVFSDGPVPYRREQGNEHNYTIDTINNVLDYERT